MENYSKLKVAVAGSFGYKDIGDEAMLTEDLEFLINHLGIPREQIYLFGHLNKYLSEYHSHPLSNCIFSPYLERVSCFHQASVLNKLTTKAKIVFRRQSECCRLVEEIANNCDFLLITGGGTINTRTPGAESLSRMHSLISYFVYLKKPVFVSGQTIGPLGINRHHDEKAKWIVENVDFLAVRDKHYSKRYLSLIDAKPKRYLETYDDAYTLSYEDVKLPDELQGFLDQGDCAAINVTQYTISNQKEKEFIARVTEYLVQDLGLNVVMVPHTPEDLSGLYVIFDMLHESIKERVFLPDFRDERDRILKKTISRCKVAVGGRYHFIVFAGTANVPFVGMCGNHYSYIKQDGFARQIGQEAYILNERDTWNFDVITRKISERLEQTLELDQYFPRPSESMQALKGWIEECLLN
jgi:polysaccharide pyruvyl transferase WcaK-like protein